MEWVLFLIHTITLWTELFNNFHKSAMAEKAGLRKKDAEAALKAFIDMATETLAKKESISLAGFEILRVNQKPARVIVTRIRTRSFGFLARDI